MGIKNQKEKFNNYKNIYNSLNFYYGKDTFRISGTINFKEDIEALARIFYKKFEELLYSKKFLSRMYEQAVMKVLKLNRIHNKKFIDILKDREFNYEAINILVIKIFDYVYYAIRKKLPYSRKLGIISKSLNELLENTFLYSSGDFCLTAGLKKEERLILIKYENNYEKKDVEMKKNIEKLKLVINEVNSIELSNDAVDDSVFNSEKEGQNGNETYPGLLKIKFHTGCRINFAETSSFFGENGITLNLSIPFKPYAEKEILSIFEKLINSNFT